MEYLTGLESLYLNAASTTITTTEDVESQITETIDEKDNLIRRQLKEIMDLKRELDIVVSERDSLLCEVNKLKFELEVAGLKKVRDELRRSSQEDLAMTSPQINGDPTNSADGSPLKLDKPPCGPGPPPNINSGECMGNCATCKQGMFKKPGSARNGDVIKRSRVQTGYELSQDLLDKQIEMLERKYGGVRARTAALTIQRAFRRYTLLKKFAAITAMAKAEKRLSRRFQMGGEPCAPSDWHHRQMRNAIYKDIQDPCDQNQQSQVPGGPGGEPCMPSGRRIQMGGEPCAPSDWHHRQMRHAMYKDLQDNCDQNQLSQVPGGPVEEPCAASEWYHRQMRNAIYKDLQDPCDQNQQNLVEPVTQRPHQRPPRPVRSLSMRERRSTSQIGRGFAGEESSHGVGPPMRGPSPHSLTGPPSQSLPRSQSAGVSAANTRSLDAEGGDLSDTPSYSQFEEACECFTNGGPMHCTNYNKHIWFHLNMSPYCDTTHDYAAKEEYLEDRRIGQTVGHSRDSSLGRGMATSPPPSSGHSEPGSGGARSSQREGRRVPPEVPKRTSSISMRSVEGRRMPSSGSGLTPQRGSRGCSANLTKSAENGSLSSVQSSGSDSSGLSTDRTTYESSEGDNQSSPIWKRKVQSSSPEHHSNGSAGITPVTSSNIPCQHRTVTMTPAHSRSEDRQTSPNLQANVSHLPDPSPTTPTNNHVTPHESPHPIYKVSDTVRKRQYRVGLNLFNKKPERGVTYLIRRGFLESTPQGVAKFLISRKGLSKQMIGEYLGNLQNPFNMAVLDAFSQELDLSGMQVDVALRKFQTYFRMPGEAQKIERLMEIYGQRYCQCNRDVVARFKDPETVFVLAFAIIMLNTDLHTPNLKPDRRMKLEDFIRNLRGIDDGNDIDRDMLIGIYERVKASEFKPSSDHVTQVMKVQSTMIGKKPNLALPHRRLVCYCRLYEIPDIYKKERPGVHQREVFLFNDLLVITKLLSKKKSSVGYVFRQSFPLCGMVVTLFEVPYYSYGIRLTQRVDGKVLVTFNARNEHDRYKFAEDLRESISEMDEMESLRIEAELERQKSGRGGRGAAAENRDSGVADIEEASPREGAGCSLAGEFSSGKHTTRSLDKGSGSDRMEVREDEMASASPAASSGCVVMRSDGARNRERPNTDGALKRSALSNSLLDIHDQFAGEKPQRRGSVGSLDSGMSISFQSTSASTVSRDSSPQQTTAASKGSNCPKSVSYQQSFLGGLFGKRERKSSRSEEGGPIACGMLGGTSPVGRSTEV